MSVGGEEQDDKNRTGAVQEEVGGQEQCGKKGDFSSDFFSHVDANQSLALPLHPALQRLTRFRKPQHSIGETDFFSANPLATCSNNFLPPLYVGGWTLPGNAE